MNRRAILVASFGTSYEDTRQKNIIALENHIREKYKEYKIYSTYTSGMVRGILTSKGIHILNIEEAMEAMNREGIEEVIVLPTHLLYGTEYEKLCKGVNKYKELFEKIMIATPLLANTEDMMEVIRGINDVIDIEEKECLVLMGHGTNHYVNPVYGALDYMCKAEGYPHIFVGTVEAYPDIDTVIDFVQKSGYSKVVLAPLMLVAGDHAIHDMASNEEGSWKIKFEERNILTRSVLKGIGEIVGIRNIYCKHIDQVI